MKVKIKVFDNAKDLKLPCHATEFSAGVDLRAAIFERLILESGKRALIPTGIAIALQKGFEAQIRPRSGNAVKFGITVMNAPGTIDSDYRGEIKVCLVNLGDKEFIINRGDRIAQMIVAKHEFVELEHCDELEYTKRSDGGFGSTGQV